MRSTSHVGGKVFHETIFPKAVSPHHIEPYTDGDLDAGLEFVIRKEVTAATDYDITAPFALEVVDVYGYNLEAPGGASTVTVKNGSTAITDAMDFNVADKAVVRAGTLDNEQVAVAKGGTIRITNSSAHDKVIFVKCLRTA